MFPIRITTFYNSFKHINTWDFHWPFSLLCLAKFLLVKLTKFNASQIFSGCSTAYSFFCYFFRSSLGLKEMASQIVGVAQNWQGKKIASQAENCLILLTRRTSTKKEN